MFHIDLLVDSLAPSKPCVWLLVLAAYVVLVARKYREFQKKKLDVKSNSRNLPRSAQCGAIAYRLWEVWIPIVSVVRLTSAVKGRQLVRLDYYIIIVHNTNCTKIIKVTYEGLLRTLLLYGTYKTWKRWYMIHEGSAYQHCSWKVYTVQYMKGRSILHIKVTM